MSYKTEATVKLNNAQIYFLRTRYGKRENISPDKLVQLAVIEVVAMQAQKELDENGYDVSTKAVLSSLAESGAG